MFSPYSTESLCGASALRRADVRIENPVLIEVDNPQGVGTDNLASARFRLTAQESQQCCLPAAIRAQQGRPWFRRS